MNSTQVMCSGTIQIFLFFNSMCGPHVSLCTITGRLNVLKSSHQPTCRRLRSMGAGLIKPMARVLCGRPGEDWQLLLLSDPHWASTPAMGSFPLRRYTSE